MSAKATKRRVVLVVDDDDMIRRLVRIVLEADDLEVLEAANGDRALEMVASEHPAIMVLDIMMPGINGVEVCRRVDHSQVKVVILTARDDPVLEDECRDAGADAFLTKPFSSDQLLALIDELVPAS
jgi:DNA-binding response OmpR family regulator